MSNTKSQAEMRAIFREAVVNWQERGIETDSILDELADRGIVLTSDPCIVKHPDQPCFVLIAQDPLAPEMVDTWVTLRIEDSPSAYNTDRAERAKIVEAQMCAEQMRDWANQHPKS